jgi:hypothetical protein
MLVALEDDRRSGARGEPSKRIPVTALGGGEGVCVPRAAFSKNFSELAGTASSDL